MHAHLFRRLLQRLSGLEAHHHFGAALFLAALGFALGGQLSWPARTIVSWDSYAASFLALAWVRIVTAKPKEVILEAEITHLSRKIIVLLVTLSACASLMAVAFLLGSGKGMESANIALRVALAVGTIMLSWLLLHTIFALHYAYLYFRPSGKRENAATTGGLVFPDQQEEPDYVDFAYFSFVIGMTSQVSDVQISSRSIRRWALVHGVISFGFNTAVLAFSLNIVSGLI